MNTTVHFQILHTGRDRHTHLHLPAFACICKGTHTNPLLHTHRHTHSCSTWWILPLCFPAMQLNPISPNYQLMSHTVTLTNKSTSHLHVHTLRLWVLRPTQRWQAPYHTVSLSPKIVFSSIKLAGPVCHANAALACLFLLPWQISERVCVCLCRCVCGIYCTVFLHLLFCSLPVWKCTVNIFGFIRFYPSICHYLDCCHQLVLLLLRV